MLCTSVKRHIIYLNTQYKKWDKVNDSHTIWKNYSLNSKHAAAVIVTQSHVHHFNRSEKCVMWVSWVSAPTTHNKGYPTQRHNGTTSTWYNKLTHFGPLVTIRIVNKNI